MGIMTPVVWYFLQLKAKYPGRPMQLDLSAGEYPNSSVSDNAITLDVPGTLVAMVLLPNNSLIPVFTLGLVRLIWSHDAHVIHGNTTGHQDNRWCDTYPKE